MSSLFENSTRTKQDGGVYADWCARCINHYTVQQETDLGYRHVMQRFKKDKA